jgi:hypothetical protein
MSILVIYRGLLVVLIIFLQVGGSNARSLLEQSFYSKGQGDITMLETWGTEPDGSGVSPASFDTDRTVFHLVNRQTAILEGDLEISGNESLMVIGDGDSRLDFTVAGSLNASVVVKNNASVILTVSQIPRSLELRDGSTVIFRGDASSVPLQSYYNLVLDNINPVFEEDGSVEIRGSIELAGAVQMPDARGNRRYDIRFSGNADQVITGNGNVLRSFNLIAGKTGGSLSLSPGNGGTVISADNQVILDMAPEAVFADNGNFIYAGNSVNISGDPGSYRLTGTLVLAGNIEGIVRGAGNNNNFNIRDSAGSNSNPSAAFNNIIISAVNNGGEFRFRDGSGDSLLLKGNLIIGSAVAGRINFFGNTIILGGDLIIENGFQGNIEPLNSLVLEGKGQQKVSAAADIAIKDLIIKNQNNPVITGNVAVTRNLHFEQGRVITGDGGLLVLEAGAIVSGNGEQRFVDGPLGIKTNNTIPGEMTFPLGTGHLYSPLTLAVNHENESDVLYIARLLSGAPPSHNLPASLSEILGHFHYKLDIAGEAGRISAIARIKTGQEIDGTQAGLLRIAISEQFSWLDLGGSLENNLLSSTIPFTGPGILALARRSPEVIIISSAGPGGSIDPEGETSLWLPGRQSFRIQARDGYHIANLFIDGVPLENPPGYFTYSYTFINPPGNKTIHADFAPSVYLDIDIFPNLANNKLHIRFMQNVEHVAIISVFTLNGVLVTEKTLSPEGNNSGSITLEGVEPGLYIIKVRYGQYMFNKKVMII